MLVGLQRALYIHLSASIDMMDSTTQPAVFNNAGVRLLCAGRTKIAQDMFRAALELISVVDHRHNRCSQQRQQVDPLHNSGENEHGNGGGNQGGGGERDITTPLPECVTLAEDCLTRVDINLSFSSSRTEEEYAVMDALLSTENLPGEAVVITGQDEENLEDSTKIVFRRNHDNLFVYSLPFELPNDESNDENRSNELKSAIIVLNLALSHNLLALVEEDTPPETQQQQQQYSDYDDGGYDGSKIGAFYNIVDQLLESSQVPIGHHRLTDLLRIAVWNNMSIWCHENGLLEDRTLYLQRLFHVFGHWQAHLCPQTMQGVRWNLWSLLTLPPASYYAGTATTTTTTASTDDQGY